MNILYILGNGFDKAQGLATSYQEFYEYWLKMKPGSELEQKVLSSIRGDYATWADLEEGLGKYSSSWQDESVFRRILKLFNKRLKEYLVLQDNQLEELSLSHSRLINELCQPELFLEESGRSIFEDYVYHGSNTVRLNVVSLNYTNTFEKALGTVNRDNALQRIEDNFYYYQGILHLHGTLNDMIVMGVNDDSQIENESFRTSEYLRRDFIKPEINDGCMNNRNSTFSRLINEAHIIVMFGVSVGVTDNKWWQAIGARMSSDESPLLLYFPYDPNKDTVASPNYKRIWSDQYITFLQEKMHITQSLQNLRNKVRVGINKDFLKLSEQTIA